MELIYYIVRQRGGWGVEYDGLCRAGRTTREAALEVAREKAAFEQQLGRQCRIRIQSDGGMWEEDGAGPDPRYA